MNTGQLAPAAWYPDPSGRHERRYWNGATWTAHVLDAGVPNVDVPQHPPPQSEVEIPLASTRATGSDVTPVERIRAAAVLFAAGAAALIAGALLRWVAFSGSQDGMIWDDPKNGLHYPWGKVCIGVGAAGLVLAVGALVVPRIRAWFWWALGASVGACVCAVGSFAVVSAEQKYIDASKQLARVLDDPSVSVAGWDFAARPGLGCWLAAVGAVLMLVAAIWGLLVHRRSRRTDARVGVAHRGHAEHVLVGGVR